MAADEALQDVPKISSPLTLFLDDKQRIIVGRGGELHSEFPDEGIAFIGRVYEQGDEGPTEYTLKPVFLDIAQPHRIFISGKSGSGKSYTLGIIIEEIQKAQMGVACVVVDIMGVFTASKEANHEQKEMESLLQWNLTPEGVQNVKIFVPEGVTEQIPRDLWDEAFSFKPEDLELDDWLFVFDINFNTAMGLCLSEVINFLRQERPEGYSIGDMVTAIQTAPQITDPEKGFAVSSRKALASKLQATQHWGIFSTHGTPMSAICQPNTCSILDVSPLNDSLRALVTGILARKILETRRQIARGGEITAEDAIPITWLIVDEAHNFAPSRGTTPALEALVRLAKEGRHPGANLVLATQQPGATSNEIISQ
ncbi:MAG TPA: ATP-binding protein, partial [Candidatus Lokiarchaeia archaeon]|nr:ATP-binding protein [Candidatus Lokiarchaeia archaeon]